MRIVAGSLKGRQIGNSAGTDIRPTSDRARAALFNILLHHAGFTDFVGCSFLDGFCGSGAVGIEAFSRGAARVFLVDIDTRVAAENLKRLDLVAAVKLLRNDLTKTLPVFAEGELVDFVFLDPPYGSGLAAAAVAQLDAGHWLGSGSIVISEVERDEPLVEISGFELLFNRTYGRARFDFWSRR
ncbi:MAG: 16S rRNA (guanine(966)-N(2))-methyltransferase RsmD [Candidatus Pacebacteria bacterium]|nr:16S rRNA (guanine(966)-N(2))-methyltransferase RsmD [Candidatus Paceibacterota bacterium]